MKSKPITLRLSPSTHRWVETVAKRHKRSRSTVIERLTEEGVRMQRFPGIAFRGLEHDRRPWVIGSSLDIWELVWSYKNFGSVEKLLSALSVSEDQVELALSYYENYQEEIDGTIAENSPSLDELREIYPHIKVGPTSA